MDSITGYNIIEAESLDEADKIAKDNPFIASIRVYEIRSM
ncbi:YciI family protein [Gemmatimonadota bacterium]